MLEFQILVCDLSSLLFFAKNFEQRSFWEKEENSSLEYHKPNLLLFR